MFGFVTYFELFNFQIVQDIEPLPSPIEIQLPTQIPPKPTNVSSSTNLILTPTLVSRPPTPTPAPMLTLPTLPSKPVLPIGLYLKTGYIPIQETTTYLEKIGAETFERWAVPLDVAGHHNDTPTFGQLGKTIIVGHSIWHGQEKVFAPLWDIKPGEEIIGINSDGTRYKYQVLTIKVSSYEDGSWLSKTNLNDKSLILYTCNKNLTGLVIVKARFIGIDNGLE